MKLKAMGMSMMMRSFTPRLLRRAAWSLPF